MKAASSTGEGEVEPSERGVAVRADGPAGGRGPASTGGVARGDEAIRPRAERPAGPAARGLRWRGAGRWRSGSRGRSARHGPGSQASGKPRARCGSPPDVGEQDVVAVGGPAGRDQRARSCRAVAGRPRGQYGEGRSGAARRREVGRLPGRRIDSARTASRSGAARRTGDPGRRDVEFRMSTIWRSLDLRRSVDPVAAGEGGSPGRPGRAWSATRPRRSRSVRPAAPGADLQELYVGPGVLEVDIEVDDLVRRSGSRVRPACPCGGSTAPRRSNAA